MLLFNQIKQDIKDGYEYFQYGTSTYKGYTVETSLEEDSVIYFVTDETHQVTVMIDRKDFMQMSYSVVSNIVMKHIYYNMVEKIEE